MNNTSWGFMFVFEEDERVTGSGESAFHLHSQVFIPSKLTY